MEEKSNLPKLSAISCFFLGLFIGWMYISSNSNCNEGPCIILLPGQLLISSISGLVFAVIGYQFSSGGFGIFQSWGKKRNWITIFLPILIVAVIGLYGFSGECLTKDGLTDKAGCLISSLKGGWTAIN